MPPGNIRVSENFSLWKYAALRGTGFPIAELERLRSSALLAKTNEVVELRVQLAQTRRDTVAALAEVIGPTSAGPLQRLLAKLKKGRIPEQMPTGDAAVEAILGPLLEKRQEVARVSEEYQVAFARGMDEILAALREFASSELAREAITWQNPGVVERALVKLPVVPDSRGTKNYHLVASYLTRYCAKNETIGFFGPTGWLTFDTETDAELRPGAALVDSRKTYFEYWCLDEVAKMASRIDDIRPYVPVRQNPMMFLEGQTLTLMSGAQKKLPAAMANLLRLCDGRLARDAVASFVSEFGEDEELEDSDCYEILEEMEEAHLLFWRLPLPPALEDPENILAQLLADIPGSDAERIRTGLADLIACRDEVAASAGDAKRLLKSQERLASSFESLTGVESLRRGGQAYAGRGLVYEDTRRDVRCVLGKPFLDSIAPALDLVMLGARWFCDRSGAKYELLLQEGFQSLLTEGSSQVELFKMMSFVAEAASSSHFDDVVEELHNKWSQILDLGAQEETIHLSSEAIRAKAEAAFASDHIGWPEACFHAPDLMVAATDFEQLAKGEGLAVLGEVHVGRNTLFAPVHYWQSQHREELLQAFADDLRVEVLDFVIPPDLASRAAIVNTIADYYEVELGETPSSRRPDRRLDAASLVVECNGGQLELVSRDGRLRYPLLTLFQSYLRGAVFSRYSLVKKQPRTPRVQIDNMVVSRAQWTFVPDELQFCSLGRGPELFLEARQWLQKVGLPDRMFMKVPEETKPVYVDFASPISVELMSRLARKASRIVLSEMLPTTDQCWLEDTHGQRYTSELRMIAVDRLHWVPRPTS